MEAIPKKFIRAEELAAFSQGLAIRVVESGFEPDFMVALWRGGAMVGCYVHEMLKFYGIKTDHIAIRTSLYTDIGQTEEKVKVYGEQYLVDQLKPTSKVLFVDDILESGRSLKAVLDILATKLADRMPPPENIRVATIYTKSEKHIEGNPKADFFIKDLSGDKWVVFPHELESLTLDELDTKLIPSFLVLKMINLKIRLLEEKGKKLKRELFRSDGTYDRNVLCVYLDHEAEIKRLYEKKVSDRRHLCSYTPIFSAVLSELLNTDQVRGRVCAQFIQ